MDARTFAHFCSFEFLMCSPNKPWVMSVRQSGSAILCIERSQSSDDVVATEGCANLSVLEIIRPYDIALVRTFSERGM